MDPGEGAEFSESEFCHYFIAISDNFVSWSYWNVYKWQISDVLSVLCADFQYVIS